jgi:hypothetical protein
MANHTPGGRVHVVLVPGFAGFDALGQIEYYAGVTPIFRKWQKAHNNHGDIDLRYFDNFPTAGVATRASRLAQYFAKRVARGELVPGHDTIALVGHSTGGLDIRRLICDLHDGTGPLAVDGPGNLGQPVDRHELLEMVKHVVFLSVPQWGTNIANWVRSYPLERKALVTEMRALVGAAHLPQVDKAEAWVTGTAARLAGAELFLAIKDALTEMGAGAIPKTDGRRQEKIAEAQEAAAELGLYLRHIATDFNAIDDLAALPAEQANSVTSPAQFDAAMRAHEMAIWKDKIATRSYATLGRRPFRFAHGMAAPRWDLTDPATWPGANLDPNLSKGTDVVYRSVYRACAGGAFRYPPGVPSSATVLGSTEQQQVEIWDNDGIVNTASALWPDGEGTILVRADHGDIIGHYRRIPAANGSGREYDAYDVFGSASGFDDATFDAVWRGVFDFCAS